MDSSPGLESLPALVASMPSGSAYVRLARGGITYVGGPYATAGLACQSAGRLFHDVPNVASVAVVDRPHVTAPSCDRRWYARAVFLADGYTALVGPFASRRQARSDLMELADRGQIGRWRDWNIDYHQVLEARPPYRPQLICLERGWHRTCTPVTAIPIDNVSTTTRPSRVDPRWAQNSGQIARWIASGGPPYTSREDMLRDVVMLWDEWPAESAVWGALATVLATIPAGRPAETTDAAAERVAQVFLELAEAIEDCAAPQPGAEDDAHRAICELRSLLQQRGTRD
jgi:hypothetical protein